MQILSFDAYNSISNDEYDQTVQLHPGWNLVSWQIKPLNPPFFISQILPDNPAHAWFHDPLGPSSIGKLYKYDNNAQYWPFYTAIGAEPWELDWAYYVYMTAPHIWDEFEYRPLMTLGPVPDIEPSSAWAHDQNVGEAGISYWFFLGYAAPGLCKLASEPIPQIAPNGNPVNFSFEGPFHWLVWHNSRPDYLPYDLKIVKTDDGKVYIPNAGDPPTRPATSSRLSL
jgi:hypothetical protein